MYHILCNSKPTNSFCSNAIPFLRIHAIPFQFCLIPLIPFHLSPNHFIAIHFIPFQFISFNFILFRFCMHKYIPFHIYHSFHCVPLHFTSIPFHFALSTFTLIDCIELPKQSSDITSPKFFSIPLSLQSSFTRQYYINILKAS